MNISQLERIFELQNEYLKHKIEIEVQKFKFLFHIVVGTL